MGEEIDFNPKLFELPSEGEVVLPNFEEVRLEDVPRLALDQIDFDMRIQEINRKPIKLPVRLDFNEAGLVYLLAYDFDSSIEGSAKFRSIYLADISQEGQAMGSGYSLIDLDETGREKVRPYVGHTFTEPDFTRQGLGLRRLVILNEANQRWFGDSLGSGAFVSSQGESSQAKGLWNQLETHGLAVKEGEGYRFR
jgi:hypothetical protein